MGAGRDEYAFIHSVEELTCGNFFRNYFNLQCNFNLLLPLTQYMLSFLPCVSLRSQSGRLSPVEVRLASRRNSRIEYFIENGGGVEQIISKLFVLSLPRKTTNRLHKPKPLFIPLMTRILSAATSPLTL